MNAHTLKQMRVTIALLSAQLESLSADAETLRTACEHPQDARRSIATFDAPERWQCRECGEIGGEPAAKEEG